MYRNNNFIHETKFLFRNKFFFMKSLILKPKDVAISYKILAILFDQRRYHFVDHVLFFLFIILLLIE